jgi:pimeloyl-ACP methyl ester carboxylesterase
MLINNRIIYIETHGDETGHPIIFLHHGLGSTQAWDAQIPDFLDAGYQVILYDRWGYGRSDTRPKLDVPDFIEDINDLNEIVKKLDISRITLVGHSDGGTIALYYAIQKSIKVDSLVIVAAHIYLESEMQPGVRKLKESFNKDQQFRNGLRRVHGEKFEGTFNNWFDGWHSSKAKEWDMRSLLSEISCPTLVIQGEEDEYATSQHALDIYENIPNAFLWIANGVKHMVPQEIPEEFNKRVIEFFKEDCIN